jgi:hypothetical protein
MIIDPGAVLEELIVCVGMASLMRESFCPTEGTVIWVKQVYQMAQPNHHKEDGVALQSVPYLHHVAYVLW